jgi:hypothetical protein
MFHLCAGKDKTRRGGLDDRSSWPREGKVLEVCRGGLHSFVPREGRTRCDRISVSGFGVIAT